MKPPKNTEEKRKEIFTDILMAHQGASEAEMNALGAAVLEQLLCGAKAAQGSWRRSVQGA